MEHGRDRYKCRHRDGFTSLPCNWVVAGFCGADARKCQIELV